MKSCVTKQNEQSLFDAMQIKNYKTQCQKKPYTLHPQELEIEIFRDFTRFHVFGPSF